MDKYCKRLIEVDLPIKRISAHAGNEKESRKAHVPQLHIYPSFKPDCPGYIVTGLEGNFMLLIQVFKTFR